MDYVFDVNTCIVDEVYRCSKCLELLRVGGGRKEYYLV